MKMHKVENRVDITEKQNSVSHDRSEHDTNAVPKCLTEAERDSKITKIATLQVLSPERSQL